MSGTNNMTMIKSLLLSTFLPMFPSFLLSTSKSSLLLSVYKKIKLKIKQVKKDKINEFTVTCPVLLPVTCFLLIYSSACK